MKKNPVRDGICGIGSAFILLCILAVFAVIFVVPLVKEWPYQTSFTLEHVQAVLNDQSLFGVYQNSIFVAFFTAVLGLLITYGAALATARSGLNGKLKGVIDAIALVTNTIPEWLSVLPLCLSFQARLCRIHSSLSFCVMWYISFPPLT